MEVPLPDGVPRSVERRHLWGLVAVAVGAAVWQYGLPNLARSYPGVTWTFPVATVGLYCWAKRWWVGAGLQVVAAAALLVGQWGGLETPAPWWFPAVSLGTVAATAVSAGTLDIARWRWQKGLEDVARDPETGLMRPWLFDWYLTKAVASARRGKTVSLVHFGIQAFDRTESWSGGDAETDLLAELGALVRETSRNEDFLARIDRDRFAALLYGEDADSAAAYAERIRRQIEFAESLTEQGCIVSAGVAEFDRDSFETPKELSQAADRALASANYAGGNRVIVFGSRSFRQATSAESTRTSWEAS